MKLLLREIQDKYIQENFKRIQKELSGLVGGTQTIINNIENVTNAPVEAVEKVIVTLLATEAISAMQLVRADSSTSCSKAVPNATILEARVYGIALNGAIIGGNVNILVFGTVTDGVLSFVDVNKTVYLGATSFLTQTPPSTTGHYLVRCGKFVGSSTAFIQIEEPILL